MVLGGVMPGPSPCRRFPMMQGPCEVMYPSMNRLFCPCGGSCVLSDGAPVGAGMVGLVKFVAGGPVAKSGECIAPVLPGSTPGLASNEGEGE